MDSHTAMYLISTMITLEVTRMVTLGFAVSFKERQEGDIRSQRA